MLLKGLQWHFFLMEITCVDEMFTVRPGMYIKKMHVDFKSTEL